MKCKIKGKKKKEERKEETKKKAIQEKSSQWAERVTLKQSFGLQRTRVLSE
jgi:hypothetical protein